MANSTFTQTGRDAMKAAIEQFPATLTTRLRAAAERRAMLIRTDMAERIAAQTHGDGNTAAALEVVEDGANKQFVVRFGMIRNRPANLPIWLEYGTIKMPAKPFAHPAAEAARAPYAADQAAIAEAAAREVFA